MNAHNTPPSQPPSLTQAKNRQEIFQIFQLTWVTNDVTSTNKSLYSTNKSLYSSAIFLASETYKILHYRGEGLSQSYATDHMCEP